MERKKITKRFWITLVSAPILVLLFALFVLPPLYEVLCDITGFNGKTGRVETEKAYVVDDERLVGVSFFSATSPGFPVQFAPKVSSMEVVPGKFYTTSYIAKKYDRQVNLWPSHTKCGAN
jgi:cytochrome c oxidase assembly protein subunit 11